MHADVTRALIVAAFVFLAHCSERTPEQDPCAGGPPLEAIPVPASIRVYHARKLLGRVEVPEAGPLAVVLEEGADEVQGARLQQLVSNVERSGSAGYTYTTRRDGVRSTCGQGVDRGDPRFVSALRHQLEGSLFDL